MNEILIEQSKYLVDKTLPNIANISNLIALLFHEMENINWLGFYICDEKNQECTLGPFQGKVACTRIPYGKGVVGGSLTLANSQNSQMSFRYGFFYVKFLFFNVVCVVYLCYNKLKGWILHETLLRQTAQGPYLLYSAGFQKR